MCYCCANKESTINWKETKASDRSGISEREEAFEESENQTNSLIEKQYE